jgi:flagellar biosynthesis/type III secretory pathway protein FliH
MDEVLALLSAASSQKGGKVYNTGADTVSIQGGHDTELMVRDIEEVDSEAHVSPQVPEAVSSDRKTISKSPQGEGASSDQGTISKSSSPDQETISKPPQGEGASPDQETISKSPQGEEGASPDLAATSNAALEPRDHVKEQEEGVAESVAEGVAEGVEEGVSEGVAEGGEMREEWMEEVSDEHLA